MGEVGVFFTSPWAVWVRPGDICPSRPQLPGGGKAQSPHIVQAYEHPTIWRAGVARMTPGSQLCIWQQCLWARPGQQPRLSLSTVALLIPEKRKPWGHLDQASVGRMLPFLCSAGSQSHGINSSEAGSLLGGLGTLPHGHMAQNTLFFVTAAWQGGPRTSVDKDASGALNPLEIDERSPFICAPACPAHLAPGLPMA